jgi:ABC-type ATPase with predicted acetyltransferase domain
MESIKASLPDLIQNRIEDLVNGQTTDEEMAAHIKELGCRIAALEALAAGGEAEQARQLAEDVQRLCERIRRDYVAIAYRQGLVDGMRLDKLVAGE